MPIPGSIETGELIRRLEEEIFEELDAAVDETIELGMRHAKRLAPVRKVSYIDRNRQTRSLSRAEVARLPALIRQSAQAIQRRGGSVLTTVRRSRQSVEAPELNFDELGERATGLKTASVAKDLTYRGRAELRIAQRSRAVTEPPGNGRRLTRSAAFVSGSGANRVTTLGGRLRGEIETIPPTLRAGRITGWVISPTEYAKYVEFPTSRTAAQPYMRPTLKYLKRPFVAKVTRNLRRIGTRRRG